MTELKWNSLTLECYDRKFHCKGCPQERYCARGYKKNEYNIKPMKRIVLKLISLYGISEIDNFRRKM